MKFFALIIVFFTASFNTLFAQIDSSKINFNEEKVVLFGETHNVLENYEIKDRLISKLISDYSEKVNIIFEFPVSVEYFINKLNYNGDSLGLKNYFDNIYNEKSAPSNYFKLKYAFLLDLYKINADKNKFEMYCIDRENHLRALVYTCHYILKKYNENDIINKQLLFLDTMLNNNKLTQRDYFLFENKFRMPLINRKEDFKTLITDLNDYYYFFKILKHPLLIKDFDTRENIMYENFLEVLKNNNLCIAFLGSAHVHKYYHKSIKTFGINRSLGFLLNTKRKSPVKKKVKSVLITNYKYNNKIKKHFTGLKSEEMKVLSGLCEGRPSMLIDPEDYKFIFATKAYDYILFMDNATKIK